MESSEVLHLSRSDSGSGAARAAKRLHHGLRAAGTDSRMLVQQRKTAEEGISGPGGNIGRIYNHIRATLDSLPRRRYSDGQSSAFSPAWVPELKHVRVNRSNPNIVHLHWINGGFLRPESIPRIDAPIVWSLHDMWPFTGGCHIAQSCRKFTTECGACPHLASNDENDISSSLWNRKYDAWSEQEINVIAPSEWMANCAAESSLFCDANINVIPNGLDVESFRPRPTGQTRKKLGVDSDVSLVCFGAAYQAHFKGIDLLYNALDHLNTRSDSYQIISIGNCDDTSGGAIQHLGYLEGESLRQTYSDVDIVVVPSRQESFGQMASEALASGTPVVAFDATGLKDIVEHKQTGYLANPYDTSDLARGIDWIINDPERLERLSEQARQVAVDRFSIETVVDEHQSLYNDIQ